MTPDVRPLVAGNWKMNGLKAALTEIAALRDAVSRGENGAAEIAVCPPATLIPAAAQFLAGGEIALGGQDCHAKASGAFTGDISADMLKDAGCAYVIVGHSERREAHGECDADVKTKAEAALRAGLSAIVCVGETRVQRDAGDATTVVSGQVRGSLPDGATPDNVVIAYEPVWAIGAGVTPTVDEIAAMHGTIRFVLGELMDAGGGRVRILYGGSVKPSNAAALLSLSHVDGALVGGASLKAVDFMAIAAVYR